MAPNNRGSAQNFELEDSLCHVIIAVSEEQLFFVILLNFNGWSYEDYRDAMQR